MNIQDLLQITIDKNASDLHINAGYFPSIRVNNELLFLKTHQVLTPKDTLALGTSILNEDQKSSLYANREIDFGFEFANARFRVNMYYSRNSVAASFRNIPLTIKSIEDLQLPPALREFVQARQGLLLFTGPTGEGKSTSLSSLIQEINLTQSKHIVTIEDPIEFVYPPARSIISQRELHQDTHSMSVALRSVLREDPDIVLVGEMRDYETIQAAITIAETGHLVLSTLHTKSTSEAIDRIIDVFPSAQQNQVRSQLSSLLISVVAQRLVPTIDHISRIPSVEILINTPAVSSIIRDGKIFMLDNVMATNEEAGMILFEKYLLKLFALGKISRETAISYAIRPEQIKKFLR